MVRQLRIQYKGAVYHVTCRGNERRSIFKDNRDKNFFIKSLTESIEIYNIILYCYVLMDNHFHLLLETPLANLSEFMRRFNITYTFYYNHRYERVGNLYQGRYKSLLVDKESYLYVLSRYIHLNPIRIKKFDGVSLREKGKYLKEYKWSSLPGYLNKKEKVKYINYRMILEEYGEDNQKGRKLYWEALKEDISKELDIKKKIVGGSILGNTEFIEKIKDGFLDKDSKEIPSIRRIVKYILKDKIVKVVCKNTGVSIDEIKVTKGVMRQILMEFLYRYGGMKGSEIGKFFDLDYSTVSVGRKRLKGKMKKDKKLEALFDKINEDLSIIKI